MTDPAVFLVVLAVVFGLGMWAGNVLTVRTAERRAKQQRKARRIVNAGTRRPRSKRT